VPVVSRKQKLIAAGAVLAVGLGLALLFPSGKKLAHALTPAPALAAATPAPQPRIVPLALDAQFSPSPPVPATSASLTIGAAQSSLAPPADAPAVTPLRSLPPASAEVPTGQPVYAPVDDRLDVASPTEKGHRIHVVHNGDTLERLADRYLSDGARALELFDLNRDVLENPHLLPIGVELRIPGAASVED
jgi:nucleoid-associated protein YgaU